MAKEMSALERYYNKFNEEKRLLRRHGNVEYVTSMHYIHKYLEKILNGPDAEAGSNRMNRKKEEIQIADIGAGTGRYSVALAEEGYSVTAVEPVKYNLGILKTKNASLRAFQGNALNLKRLEDDCFDLTILFGPMYHLFTFEDKKRALSEAKRITKQGGVLFIAYCMNEFCVITHGFKENYIKESIAGGKLTEDFCSISSEEDLYDYVRLEEIDRLKDAAGLERIQIISADGPANYMRRELNTMDEETYELFIKYHLKTCERPELLGAGAHTVDILRKTS